MKDDLVRRLSRDILADVVDLNRKLAMAPVHKCDDADVRWSTEIHQGIHARANRSPCAHDVFDEHHDAVINRGWHLSSAQKRPASAGRQIIAVERRIKDAEWRTRPSQALKVIRQKTGKRHAAIGDRNKVEAFRAIGALDDLVRDTH